MKKYKFIIIKTALLTLLIIPFLMSCDENESPKSDKKELTSVQIIAGSEIFAAQLGNDGKTWGFNINSDFNMNLLKTATVHYTVSNGTYATYPLSGSTHDFTVSPMGIVASAEDGTEVYYAIVMNVQ